ncbi:RHS repeat-associated core domain-containing protein, partial [Pseudomonas syringae]|uniref:RHS repeat-associated core domain-containing protein n=1 Tax=Pseudomonas syringae TaxID=317 RepID=UPI0016054459
RFAYDDADRLIEEKRIDNLTRRFSYNLGGHLTQVEEIGYGEKGEQPRRSTHLERDPIGRLLAKLNDDARQDYTYDDGDRLLSIERKPTDTGRKLGITAEKIDFAYDLLGRLVKETTPQGALAYEYDPLSNLTTLTLPTGQHLNHLYYGSGHLHQLNLDGQLISDMERDDLHREVYRTQGKLTSCFGYDSMGRKAWQYATTLPAEKLSQIQNPLIKPERYVEHAYNPIHRRYEYDPAGELSRTLDKLRGETQYEYEANGQLLARNTGRVVDGEEFRYDAAANRLNFNTSRFDHVKDNRLKQWANHEYKYDAWGNLIEKVVGIVRWQTFTYDCENRLVKTETMADTHVESTSSYQYDSLGRRVAKQSELKGHTDHKRFLWQGLRMLREESPGQSSLYIYEPGSYAPLARVDEKEGEVENKVYYFHTDQIGTPLEMTDAEGQIVWQAKYRAWGAVEKLVVNEVEQNLRFQGQYFDVETGLHYNTFRYYDPEIGRFITQDPIGLSGGTNLYFHTFSPNNWIDPLGWCSTKLGNNMGAKPGDGMANHHLLPEELIKSPQFKTMFGRLKGIGWDPDGASNGIFLPGSKNLAQTTGMPGHWSNHGQYTEAVKNKLVKLNNNLGSLTDIDLALGVKNIQAWASQGLENGLFKIDAITGRLL